MYTDSLMRWPLSASFMRGKKNNYIWFQQLCVYEKRL